MQHRRPLARSECDRLRHALFSHNGKRRRAVWGDRTSPRRALTAALILSVGLIGGPSPSLAVTQCDDTIDNDSDGRIDLADAGCLADPARDDESGEIVVNSSLDKVDAVPGDGVCETDVPGECTVRAAVMEANAIPGQQGVQVPAGTFELTIARVGNSPTAADGDLDIVDDLVIIGAGAENTRVGGDDTAFRDRVFEIAADKQVTLSRVAVHQEQTGLNCWSGRNGGGIYNLGTLTLTDTAVSENRADDGAGIYNEATLTLLNSTVSGNTVYQLGGGIYNSGSGTMTLSNSTVSGNDGCYDYAYDGGGISNTGSATIISSTVSDNWAWYGGGIESTYSGTLTLINTTVSGNFAGGSGGGINNGADSILTLTNSTVTENYAYNLGGGIRNTTWGSSVVQSTNSIVAGNDGYRNCSGPFTSLGHNLSDDTSCFSASGTDIVAAAQLGPLADNGGPTRTHLPLAGSPAIDAGDNAACPPTDQRGEPRPMDGNDPPDGFADCDIGAVEVVPEPGGLFMLALGITFLGTVGRSRRRA